MAGDTLVCQPRPQTLVPDVSILSQDASSGSWKTTVATNVFGAAGFHALRDSRDSNGTLDCGQQLRFCIRVSWCEEPAYLLAATFHVFFTRPSQATTHAVAFLVYLLNPFANELVPSAAIFGQVLIAFSVLALISDIGFCFIPLYFPTITITFCLLLLRRTLQLMTTTLRELGMAVLAAFGCVFSTITFAELLWKVALITVSSKLCQRYRLRGYLGDCLCACMLRMGSIGFIMAVCIFNTSTDIWLFQTASLIYLLLSCACC